jgi:Ni2+-binding GTPase involved in maturation of urease and hydrogenase
MSLLLGPPGSGKTSLLLALAGKLDSTLKVQHLHILFDLSSFFFFHTEMELIGEDTVVSCNIINFELDVFRCQGE